MSRCVCVCVCVCVDAHMYVNTCDSSGAGVVMNEGQFFKHHPRLNDVQPLASPGCLQFSLC